MSLAKGQSKNRCSCVSGLCLHKGQSVDGIAVNLLILCSTGSLFCINNHIVKACLGIHVLDHTNLIHLGLSVPCSSHMYPSITLYASLGYSLNLVLTYCSFFQFQLVSLLGVYSHQFLPLRYLPWTHWTHMVSFFWAMAQTNFTMHAMFYFCRFLMPIPRCFLGVHSFSLATRLIFW